MTGVNSNPNATDIVGAGNLNVNNPILQDSNQNAGGGNTNTSIIGAAGLNSNVNTSIAGGASQNN